MTQKSAVRRRKLLRTFRNDLGITLIELGKLADVSQPMLSQFERGDRDLSEEAWARVFSAIEKLLDDADARRKQEREKAQQTAAKLGVLSGVLREMNFGRADIPRLAEELAQGKDLLRKVAELPPDYLEHPVIKELIASYQREIEVKDERISQLAGQLKQPARVAKK